MSSSDLSGRGHCSSAVRLMAPCTHHRAIPAISPLRTSSRSNCSWPSNVLSNGSINILLERPRALLDSLGISLDCIIGAALTRTFRRRGLYFSLIVMGSLPTMFLITRAALWPSFVCNSLNSGMLSTRAYCIPANPNPSARSSSETFRYESSPIIY